MKYIFDKINQEDERYHVCDNCGENKFLWLLRNLSIVPWVEFGGLYRCPECEHMWLDGQTYTDEHTMTIAINAQKESVDTLYF